MGLLLSGGGLLLSEGVITFGSPLSASEIDVTFGGSLLSGGHNFRNSTYPVTLLILIPQY